MRIAPLLVMALVSLAITHCGSAEEEPGYSSPETPADDGASDGGSVDDGDGAGDIDDTDGPTADGDVTDDERDAGEDAQRESCTSERAIAELAACIDEGQSPRACAAKATHLPCDVDGDGLDDALEDALLRSYAPVFAYNAGDGSHKAGDSEPNYPLNARHFVASSTLYWRVDDDDATRAIVFDAPTLEGLPSATFDQAGTTRHASSPALGEGPNFWLCLNQVNGEYPAEALVGSMEASRSLPGGIDLFGVAHPTSPEAGASSRYVALGYMVLYAYNKFSLDDHEGDFEGGAVFVDMDTGDVVALYTARHATSDKFLLVPLDGPNALPAKDPAGEQPLYDVCSDTSNGPIAGVRFWDYAQARHHPVLYVSGGGHASYGYPGATKIQGVGCIEATIVRDVHNGAGPKLVPHENAYYAGWGSGKMPVEGGVRIENLGERGRLREAWSAFAGQWGCTLKTIPKSYPGPWDNARLCRHWLTDDWGAAPPFAQPPATSCE